MTQFYYRIRAAIAETLEEYQNQTFIDQHNNLQVRNLWPSFTLVVKLYFLYGIIRIIVENILNFEDYNSRVNTRYDYFAVCGLPPIIILYHHIINQKLKMRHQIIIQIILMVSTEIVMHFYLCIHLADANDQILFLSGGLMNTSLIFMIANIRSLVIRIFLVMQFYASLIIVDQSQLITSMMTVHILFIVVVIVQQQDQQLMQLTKVNHFSQQSLKSVPSAVCILSSNCRTILFSNQFMQKMISKSYVDQTLTKSIRVLNLGSIPSQQSELPMSVDKIKDFLLHLYADVEDVKQQFPLDLHRFECLQDEEEVQTNIDIWQLLEQINKSDKRTQGRIYNFRCQYLKDDTDSVDDKHKVVIEVRIKTQLQFEQNNQAILLNLYDISTNLKSLYYKNLNQFKSKVIRSISHELRTRLNVIQGMIQIIQGQQSLDMQTKKLLRAAYNNCQIQTHIIGSIIDYNLLRENQLALKIEKCKLQHLVKDVIELFLEEAELKNIKIAYENKLSHHVQQLIDQEKLKSILIHILSNSIKFTKNLGLITIKLSKDSNTPVRQQQQHLKKKSPSISSFQPRQGSISDSSYHESSVYKGIKRDRQSRYLQNSQFSLHNIMHSSIEQVYVIEIKDTGIGIESLQLSQIQEMLIDENEGLERISKNNLSEGMMIGLRASNSIAKFINGNEEQSGLKIDSIQGQGTVVQLFLKARISQTDQVTSEFAHKESAIENEESIKTIKQFANNIPQFETLKKPQEMEVCTCENDILIVDDEPYNLMVLRSLLEKLKQRVIVADDGITAVEIVKQRAELAMRHKCKGLKGIIMDYQMPIMNGEQAAKHIRRICQDFKIFDIPIFGLTGFSGEEDINRLIEAGMQEVYIKPITNKSLEQILIKIQRGVVKSFDYIGSNVSQQFQCIEIDYAEDDRLVE